MMTLSYATGPNFSQTFPDKSGQRANLTGTVFRRFLMTEKETSFISTWFILLITRSIYTDKNTVYPGLFPTENEYHGGDDVAVYATGTWIESITIDIYEQIALRFFSLNLK